MEELIPVLQIAIGPVILISGVGLLLLTMTNRYGRVIDRSHTLIKNLTNLSGEDRDKLKIEVQVLWKRALVLRTVIALASISALTAATLIFFLFIAALWQLEQVWIIGLLFTICLASLIGSLVLFIYDINLSLAALKLELDEAGGWES